MPSAATASESGARLAIAATSHVVITGRDCAEHTLLNMTVSSSSFSLLVYTGRRAAISRTGRRLSTSGPRQRLPQLVFHDLAAADDHAQVLAVGREQRDVLERIAVDHQQVGVRARRDAAELALLQHQLGVDGGGLPQELERREDFAANGELAALLHVGRAEQVGAEADLDAGAAHLVQARQRLLVRVLGLLQAHGRKAELLARLD